MVSFYLNSNLRNIISGIVAKDANLREYESVRRDVVHRMLGKHVFLFAFKRMGTYAKNLSISSGVTVAPSKYIDFVLLIQQYFCLQQRPCQLDLEDVIRYQLSPYQKSPSENNFIVRKAQKMKLELVIEEGVAKNVASI